MSSGLGEAEIIQGLRLGDRQAWEALYQQYSGQIWRYVARLVGSDTEAVADVFQETILAAAKAGRNIANNSTLWAWLARIGHNQAALYWRKRYRDPPAMLDGESFPAAVSEDPLEALKRVETVESIRSLLAEMQPDYVAILTAKYLDELSVPRIADMMGESREALRSRLARARQDFRQRYERLVRNENEPSVRDLSPRERD